RQDRAPAPWPVRRERPSRRTGTRGWGGMPQGAGRRSCRGPPGASLPLRHSHAAERLAEHERACGVCGKSLVSVRFSLRGLKGASFPFYLSWVFIMSWSVFAMEAAACYIGECRDPARDAKIAMTASSLYGFFIYVTLPLMLVVVLGHALGE